MRWARVVIFLCLSLPLFMTCAQAKELTIIYTGQSHAMLYPCNCPLEPEGGLARRATLIKQMRKMAPDLILIDCGNFSAGGAMDEFAQNAQLDMQRSRVNLNAMGTMGYDAVAVGEEEFNFGRDFFLGELKSAQIKFVSANLQEQGLKAALIKDAGKVRVGIFGLTATSGKTKESGLKLLDPAAAARQQVLFLKQRGAQVIILLSTLGEKEELRLIEAVKGIDIVFSGASPSQQEQLTKVGNTLVVRPAWQARRLGKLNLQVKDAKITDYKAAEEGLSAKIPDDPDVLSLLPRCFSDRDCQKENLLGSCQEQGSLGAQCLFTEPRKVNLLVISSKDCSLCNTEQVVKYLKKQIPGITPEYINYPGKQSEKLIKELSLEGLPVYIIGKEAKREKNFDSLQKNLQEKGDFYLLNPQLAGVTYFINRPKIDKRVDLFISLFDEQSAQLLEALKDFDLQLHFLAVENKNGFDAKAGQAEVEEYMRALCVEKYYPRQYRQYLSCRSARIKSTWWEDCAEGEKAVKIRQCARTEEGKLLLRENIRLNKELRVMFGPVFLLDNREIFSVKGAPSKERLSKIIKR